MSTLACFFKSLQEELSVKHTGRLQELTRLVASDQALYVRPHCVHCGRDRLLESSAWFRHHSPVRHRHGYVSRARVTRRRSTRMNENDRRNQSFTVATGGEDVS